MCSAAKKPPLPPQSSAGGGLRTRASDSSSGYVGYGIGGVTTSSGGSRRRFASDLGNVRDIEMAKARAAMLAQTNGPGQDGQTYRHHHHGQHQARPGLLETDLDAPVDPEEVKARSLLNLNGHLQYHQPLAQHHSLQYNQANSYHNYEDEEDGGHHLRGSSAQGGPGAAADSAAPGGGHHQRPHKSMEFLLDKENLHFVKVS